MGLVRDANNTSHSNAEGSLGGKGRIWSVHPSVARFFGIFRAPFAQRSMRVDVFLASPVLVIECELDAEGDVHELYCCTSLLALFLQNDTSAFLTTGHLSSLGMVAGLATRTRTPPLRFPPSLLFLVLAVVPSSSSRHGIAHTAIPP